MKLSARYLLSLDAPTLLAVAREMERELRKLDRLARHQAAEKAPDAAYWAAEVRRVRSFVSRLRHRAGRIEALRKRIAEEHGA